MKKIIFIVLALSSCIVLFLVFVAERTKSHEIVPNTDRYEAHNVETNEPLIYIFAECKSNEKINLVFKENETTWWGIEVICNSDPTKWVVEKTVTDPYGRESAYLKKIGNDYTLWDSVKNKPIIHINQNEKGEFSILFQKSELVQIIFTSKTPHGLEGWTVQSVGNDSYSEELEIRKSQSETGIPFVHSVDKE